MRKGFAGIWKKLGMKWKQKDRDIEQNAPLHLSVLERFAASGILDYDVITACRPEPLRYHDEVKHYYV